MATTYSVFDDFNDNSFNTGKWVDTGSVPVSETNQRLQESLSGSNSNGFYSANTNLTFSNSSFSIQNVLVSLSGASHADIWVQALTGNANFVGWTILGTTLQAAYSNDLGNIIVAASVTYNQTTHAWLRVRHSSATIFWDTSTDGITWTNYTSVAMSSVSATATIFDANTIISAILTGVSGSGTSNYYLDNINLTPVPKTQTGKARITAIVPRTQTGVARITASTSKTQTGKSRITATTAKTQLGKASIQKTIVRTQLGVARIIQGAQRNQTGVARITATATRTQLGRARIQVTTAKTQTGRSRISVIVARTQTGIARLTATTSRLQLGVARIRQTVLRTQTGKSAIVYRTTRTQTGRASIGVSTSCTQTGRARLIAGYDLGTMPYGEIKPELSIGGSEKPLIPNAAGVPQDTNAFGGWDSTPQFAGISNV